MQEKDFLNECKEVRSDFVQIAGMYAVGDHLRLRTEADSLLIMYDQLCERVRQLTEESRLGVACAGMAREEKGRMIVVVGHNATGSLLPMIRNKLHGSNGSDVVLLDASKEPEQQVSGLKGVNLIGAAIPIVPRVNWPECKTGKEKRRERREQARKMINKHRK